MDSAPHARRTAFDLATVVLFLAAILAPTVDRFVRPDEVRGPRREGRTAEPKPAFALDAATLSLFPERCERWFGDTFGLRDVLLRWNSIEKLELLRISPTPKIVLGEDDWLLYAADRTLDVWRGLDPLSPEELEAWRRMLESNRDRLAPRGIRYLFAFGPNKETIYPEKVPAKYGRVGPTRLEQLDAYLREHSDFRLLDLRPALRAAKKEDVSGDELYLRDGTHWNARGALVAYRELVGALATSEADLAPLAPDRIESIPMPEDGDSWRYRMGVDDRNPQRGRSWRIVPAARAAPVLEYGPAGTGRVRVTELPERTPLRVLLLHDSFASYFEPLVTETLSHLSMHFTHRFRTNDLEVERPTVVVHLLVERALVAIPPRDLEMTETPTDRELFERSSEQLWTLDPSSVTAWSDAACAPAEDGGVRAEFRDWKGLVLLPELPLAGGTVLSAEVSTPEPTSLLVFYKPDPSAPYGKRNSVGAQIEAGRGRVILRLPPGIRGRIGLRIGVASGSLRLHALEIRRDETAGASTTSAK